MAREKPAVWRSIPPMVASGRLQMAIDAWLLQQHQQGNHPPTLRFYRFDPVALSLGYLQRAYPRDWDSLEYRGRAIDLVYRPTGGRAVLHHGDVCYSLITSNMPGKRAEIYGKLCQFLIEGWRSLGLDLDYGDAGRGYIHNPSCFATATNADLVDGRGHKFIGSALRISDRAILQQGSMGFAPDPHLYRAIFGETPPKTPFDDRPLDGEFLEEAIATLTAAASRCFTIELHPRPLSAEELGAIEKFGEPRSPHRGEKL